MKIAGLQKLTLLDFPGQVACTVFTPGCQFICPYCHNAALVTAPGGAPFLDMEEFWTFLEGRSGILDGVCITGGEPTLQPGLEDCIRRIKDLGFSVKLDTNGYEPQILKGLVQQGLLDYVAMDIKNTPDKYAQTTGLVNLDIEKIKESVDFLKSGSVDFEFRTTIVQEFHTEEDMLVLGQWLKGDSKYFLQEFKDTGGLICSGLHPVPIAEMERFRAVLRPFLPLVELRKS